MQTPSESVEGAAKGGKNVKGRKDSEGQEAVINLKPLKDNIKNLVALKKKEISAKDARSDAVKATAEKCGVQTSAVNQLVNAIVADRFEQEKRKVDQGSLLFEEVGQDPKDKPAAAPGPETKQ